MKLYLLLLLIAVSTLILTVMANHLRARQIANYKLVPNCLLTRAPLLFITGPRSIFYFKSYWNVYPSYLAEHGYEVYTLQIPWRSNRLASLKKTFSVAEAQSSGYHLILDKWTWAEINKLNLENSPKIRSMSVLADSIERLPTNAPVISMISTDSKSLLQRSLYHLHSLLFTGEELPSLVTLGGTKGNQMANARLLLERARALAEDDLLKLS